MAETVCATERWTVGSFRFIFAAAEAFPLRPVQVYELQVALR